MRPVFAILTHQFLGELCLQKYHLLTGHSPSLIAACCISYALYCCGGRGCAYWDASMEATFGHAWAQTEDCIRVIHGIHVDMPTSPLNVIRKRYRLPGRENASEIKPPEHLDMSWPRDDGNS